MTESVAIISGGTGYLGSAITAELTAAGWEVVALSRDTAPPYRCDITDEQAVRTAMERVVERFGHIDACIHAASPGLETGPGAAAAHMATAVLGADLLARFARPHMGEGAAFIGITSTLADTDITAEPLGSYIAAKRALRAKLRDISTDPANRGIRVYAVAPGYMPGGLNEGVPAPMLDMLAKRSGAGLSDVQEIARLVVRLLVDPSAYASGYSLTVSPIKAEPL